MKVRDKTQPRNTYGGALTEASDRICPCRPCYHPHDWKTPVPVYKNGKHITNKYTPDFRCCTRENNGCPNPIPDPQHKYVSDKALVCKRCGFRRKKG